MCGWELGVAALGGLFLPVSLELIVCYFSWTVSRVDMVDGEEKLALIDPEYIIVESSGE